MTHRSSQLSRRSFIRHAALVAAASGLPGWYLAEVRGADEEKPRQEKPGSDAFRIGLVGCGGMGTGDGKDAQRFGKVVAVCDVDDVQLARAKTNFPGAAPFKDFRKLVEQKDIDVVLCSTVDHWHTLVSMAAMRAGKDVHCQKPLTLCIDEGKRLMKVQKETKRVLQTGTQQRSDIRFRLAVDLVRGGRIGKLQHIDVWLPSGLRDGPFKASAAPAGFNWDLWQGQTAAVDYMKERGHRTFRYWWEYAAGTITDWGAHHNDIALWATGFDRSGPVSVEGKALNEMIPGGYTANSEYELLYTYANGVTHAARSTKGSQWNGAVGDPKLQPHGIKFQGSDGWLWVTRGQIDASRQEIIREKLSPAAPRVYVSNDHKRNFFECVKTRKAPICDVEIGHRSATMCHLGAAAIRLGRKLNWDPAKEEYMDDAEAQGTVSRVMRKPYDYSFIGM